MLAGIPSVARGMFEQAVPMLKRGKPITSAGVDVYLRESDFAAALDDIQSRHAAVEVGSYPFSRDGRFGATLVVRGTDSALIERVLEEVVAAMTALGGETRRI